MTISLTKVANGLRSSVLAISNFLGFFISPSPIVDKTGVESLTVSFTSHRRRVKYVGIMLHSLKRGCLKPTEVIFNISDTDARKNAWLLREIAKRGVTINVCENFGPHTKWYPTAVLGPETDFVLLVDDDVIYPKDFVSNFLSAARLRTDHSIIFATRAAHRSLKTGQQISGSGLGDTYGKSLVPLGVGGVLYRTSMLVEIFEKFGKNFLQVAPKNDDIYLHFASHKLGFTPQLVETEKPHLDIHFLTYIGGLMRENVKGGQNNLQFKMAFEFFNLN